METSKVKWGYLEERFDVKSYLQKNQYNMYKKKANDANQQYLAFEGLKTQVLDYFKEKFEKSRSHEQESWITKQHEAITGVSSSIEWIKRETEEFLRRSNMLATPYPAYYSDLIEATYQETYGLGPISTWWKHPKFEDSQAARIFGTNIFFEIPGEQDELQAIKYNSEAEVLRVAKQLSLRKLNTAFNAHNPSLQVDMADGTRVTIIIPPWSVRPLIIFRNFTKKKPTLNSIQSYGTFSEPIAKILRTISKGRGTTVVCGPVKSGKTTLLSALIAERDKYDKMVILQQGFDELRVSESYPDYAVMELLINDENKKEIFDLVLRSDYEYIVVGELRSKEAEVFLKATERGKPGALTSYHTPDLIAIPSQLADIILDEHPTKSYEAQYQRVARNIHFAISMEELPDRSKRLINITVFDWNPETKEFKVHELVKYDYHSKAWSYTDYIPKRVFEILERYAPTEAHEMQDLLTKLSRKG